MTADAWEVRTARLEGAYEQFDRRLGALETRLGSVENRITALDQRIDMRFAQVDVSFANLRGEMRGPILLAALRDTDWFQRDAVRFSCTRVQGGRPLRRRQLDLCLSAAALELIRH